MNQVVTPQELSLNPPSMEKRTLELRSCPKSRYLLQDPYRSSLTVSLWRPFARRRARTARPFFVAIRCRNPWVFFRFRLWGWKVRFIEMYS